MGAATTQQARLLFGGAVEDDANFFQGDEATVDHFVKFGKDLVDAFLVFDDFENDREVLRKAQEFVGVVDARLGRVPPYPLVETA